MIEFFVSFIWLAIGFMMTFMILFPNCASFKLKNLPGGLVTVIVMMLGELEFKDLYFPSSSRVNLTNGDGEIHEQAEYLQFPGREVMFLKSKYQVI